VEMEARLRRSGPKDPLQHDPLLKGNGQNRGALVAQARRLGYADATIARLSGSTLRAVRSQLGPKEKTAYKMVDTAAAEFPAQSPYYYATVGEEDELRRP